MEERRAPVIGATSAVKWYVLGVVVVAALTIIGVSLVAILAPMQAATIGTLIVGFSTPLAFALLSGGVLKMAVATDGKLSQLVAAREEAAHAQGIVQGLIVNPKTNIGEDALP